MTVPSNRKPDGIAVSIVAQALTKAAGGSGTSVGVGVSQAVFEAVGGGEVVVCT